LRAFEKESVSEKGECSRADSLCSKMAADGGGGGAGGGAALQLPPVCDALERFDLYETKTVAPGRARLADPQRCR
jgi:hypothetical protein